MFNRNKILIVDDIELNRDIMRGLLDDKYEIIEAENGLEAMEAIHENLDSIALILLDIIMPFMDGIQVMEKLNEEDIIYKIPVILITAENSIDIEKRGHELGASDFIMKPFNAHVVRSRVSNVIELYATKNHLEYLVENQTVELYKKNLELMEKSEKLSKVNEGIIEILATIIEHRNTESTNHIKRIKLFTKMLLKALKEKYPEYALNDYKINLITNASAMHDIGKIVMPDEVLLKKEKVTEAEFEILKQHSIKGCEILEKLEFNDDDYFKCCYEICRYHHEKWDGKGYPDGLKGDEIPISAQVVSIADAYDSITSENPYRNEHTHEEAVKMILNGECGAFSDKIIDCFKDVIEKYEILAKQYNDSVVDVKNDEFRQALVSKEIERKDEGSASAFNSFVQEDASSKFIFALTEYFDNVFETNAEGSKLSYYALNEEKSYFKELPQTYNELYIKSLKNCHIDDEALFMDTFSLEKINERAKKGIFKSEVELRIKDLSQNYRWVHCVVSTLVDAYLNTKSIVICMKNINSIKERETKILFDACHDSLTRVWNRSYMEEYGESFVKTAENKYVPVLILINISDFKNVNAICGHKFGDYVLKKIANTLVSEFMDNGVVGRVGGDKFMILVKKSDNLDEKLELVKKLIFKEYEFEDKAKAIYGGIGIAMYPESGMTFDILFDNAKIALEKSKRSSNKEAFICGK